MKAIDYENLDYSRWYFHQWAFQKLVRILLKFIAQINVEDSDHMPSEGPVVLAINHLHISDIVLFFSIIPRRTICLVSNKWETKFFTRWVLNIIGQVIWVHSREPEDAQSKSNRQALKKGLMVLQKGGILGVAPEGTRSAEGLKNGLPGIAYMANRASAPILIVVGYGQEQAFTYWKRLRRVPVHIRFGTPIQLPTTKMKTDALQTHTDQIMAEIARLLPPQYQGIYEDNIKSMNTQSASKDM